MYPYQIYEYLQNVDQYLKYQQETILSLEEEVLALKNEIKEIREKNFTNIEKIEYKFDQLKVETLEGTLNIGLTPQGADNIEDFSVNQSTQVPHVLNKYPDMFPRIQDHVNQYLDEGCYHFFNDLQDKYQRPIPDEHRHFILQDVHKQVDERIHHYLKQVKEEELSRADPSQIEQYTVQNVQNDINQAIEAYIQNMPKGGNY